ncbi:MAG: outer membrane protein assembly factor BamD [Acidobacteriota bacterium]
MSPHISRQNPTHPSARSTTRVVRHLGILLVSLTLAGLLGGCGGPKEDPILRLSSDEALDLGKSYMTDEKWVKARRHLIHAFEVEPNSRQGREALLLAADAYYQQGGIDNYIKCEAKYRDFLNRFPTSERADYAQFKVADCLASRTERPDRDQSVTEAGLAAFEELLRLYPTSEHVPQARQRIRELTDQLAAHELVIGTFYTRFGKRGICQGAVSRLEHLRDTYPQFSRMDEGLYQLAVAYSMCRRPVEALESLATLRRRYPDSERLEDALDLESEIAESLPDDATGVAEAVTGAEAATESNEAGTDEAETTGSEER